MKECLSNEENLKEAEHRKLTCSISRSYVSRKEVTLLDLNERLESLETKFADQQKMLNLAIFLLLFIIFVIGCNLTLGKKENARAEL